MTLYHQRRISHLLVLLFAECSSLPLARKPHENRVGFLTVKSVNLPQCLNTLSRHLSGSVGQGSDFGSGHDPTLPGLGLKILLKVGPSIPSGPNRTARVFLATASIAFGPRPCWFLRWVQGGSTGGFQPVSLWRKRNERNQLLFPPAAAVFLQIPEQTRAERVILGGWRPHCWSTPARAGGGDGNEEVVRVSPLESDGRGFFPGAVSSQRSVP